MAANHDWLPQNHEALYDKANQTMNYLNSSGARVRLGKKDLGAVFLNAIVP
jgi:hypothetical protein